MDYSQLSRAIPCLLAHSASTMIGTVARRRGRSGQRAQFPAVRNALRIAALAAAWTLTATAHAQSADGDLRLTAGGGEFGFGLLEVYHNDEWGMVCDDFFDNNSADVACRQLGYDGAVEYLSRLSRQPSRTIWLDDVRCNGLESKLVDCQHTDWGDHNCAYEEHVAVRCNTASSEPSVRTFPGKITITEDRAPKNYGLRLFKEPTGTVTVTPATTSTAISLSPASLTFTTSNWDTTQNVEVSATVDDTYDRHTATVTHTVAGADYDGIAGPVVSVTVRDPDNRAGVIGHRQVDVYEGDAAGTQYTVALAGRPIGGDTTVSIAVPEDAPITVTPTTLTFTATDWSTAQSVTVSAPEDDDHANETHTLTHSASGGTYDSIPIADVEVRAWDNDFTVTSTPRTLSFNEGEDTAQTYTLSLEQRPLETVTVEVHTGPKLTVSHTEIRFTPSNWNRPRTITVRQASVEDDDAADETIEITHTLSVPVQVAESVTVTIHDNDENGVQIAGEDLDLAEGETGHYEIALSAAPLGTATVTITGMEGTSVSVSPTSLEFNASNWNEAQTVSVESTHDADGEDEAVTLHHEVTSSYFSGPIRDIGVHVEDDDERTILTGPPNADTVWWGTFRAGDNAGLSFGYLPALGVGYLSDTDFDYAGAMRTIQAIYLSDGTLHMWMEMGDADALPNTMVLHIGDDVLPLADAQHIDHDAGSLNPRLHWYRWPAGQHEVDWTGGELVGIWLEGPREQRLPAAPTALTATPVPGGVSLQWEAPNDGGSPILEYEYQQRDDTGVHGRFWWSTEGTAATYTVRRLRPQTALTFRVRAVNRHGNGAESQMSAPVTPLPVNHAPTGAPRVIGRAVPGRSVKANMATVEDPNGLENAEFRYQWKRSDAGGEEEPIPGANAKSYRMREEDRGTRVKVEVAFTDDSGFAETVESEPRVLEESLLVARLTGVPEEHDGANPFTLRLRLSEDVATRARTLREESFTVTNGAVERARRIGSGRNLWELAIRPATDAEVVVEVPLREACDVAGAICTADGRWLSHAITHAIPGPLSVSVADAGAEEGLDQGLRFIVALSRAVDRAVSVDYETEDGTARAGSDYEAATGTLEFEPGETEAVVVVAVLDDAVDEGEETFTFVLTSASGARIGDARATGTIENSDPLQEQWLTRFGRTVASQVVDTIGDRLQSSRGSHLTIAGHGFGPGNAKDGDDTHWSDIEKDKGLDTLSEREFGLGSSFQLSSGADNGPGAVWTTWGRMATSGFASNDDELALDGDVTSALLGFDAESGSWLAGAAVAHSRGDGTYRHSSDVETSRGAGKVRSTLTSIHPYARVRTDDDVSLWAIAGYGTGTLTLPGWCAEGRADAETSLDMRMAAAGVRGTVLAGASPSDLEIGVRSDVTWSQTRSERATSVECGNVESARADTTRTRLVMDGARTWELEAGRTLTPSVEIGLRHDGGDAETGLGLEAGARLRYRDAATGLLLEGGVRGLIAHEASGYEEWGASASVMVEPDGNGRGLSLRVAPSWGAASSSVERLWSGDDTARLGQSPEYDDAAALQAELGYGVRAPFGWGVVTPYTGLTLSGEGRRTWRAGGRWKAAPAFGVTLEGSRDEEGGDEAPENAVMLRGSLRW